MYPVQEVVEFRVPFVGFPGSDAGAAAGAMYLTSPSMQLITKSYGSATLLTFAPWKWIPNSVLPVVVFPGAVNGAANSLPATMRETFRKNGWTNNWTAGIYPYPHYHSNTHEVLGVVRGSCTVQLGGPEGYNLQATAGDVIVLPAGVAHACYTTSTYAVIGGYPGGRSWDLNTEDTAHPSPEELPVPGRDPVGDAHVLRDVWKS